MKELSSLVALMLAMASACGGMHTEIDGEGDSDIDADSDVDSDADSDSDEDMDADPDVDRVPDWALCAELSSGFREELRTLTDCREHADCVPHDFGAPELAHCYTAISRNVSTDGADSLAAQWMAEGCNEHTYDCEPAPPTEIRCAPRGECVLIGEEYDQCSRHREAYIAEAERLNHCEEPDDCVLRSIVNCGVLAGCWVPVNGSEDHSRLRELEDYYTIVLCPYATCTCDMPFFPSCSEGLCIGVEP